MADVETREACRDCLGRGIMVNGTEKRESVRA